MGAGRLQSPDAGSLSPLCGDSIRVQIWQVQAFGETRVATLALLTLMVLPR